MKMKTTSICLLAAGLLCSSLVGQTFAAEKDLEKKPAGDLFRLLHRKSPGLFPAHSTGGQRSDKGIGKLNELSGVKGQLAGIARTKAKLEKPHVSDVPNFKGWTLTEFAKYIHKQGVSVKIDPNLHGDFVRELRKINNERTIEDLPFDWSGTGNPLVQLGPDDIVRVLPGEGQALPRIDPDRTICNSSILISGPMSLSRVLDDVIPSFDLPLKYEVLNGVVTIMSTSEEDRQERRMGTKVIRVGQSFLK